MTDLAPPRRLVLPPPYHQHWLASGDVLAEAIRRAPEGGAGTFVWSWVPGAGPGRLDFAVVLEPETPLSEARLAFLAGMVALSEAVAAHCPPERAVRFGWPGELRFDAGRLGGARLAAAPETGEDGVPDWMVFGVELIADRDHLTEPGGYPDSLSLKEEGFDDPPAIAESFAAHLMLVFDRWKHEGRSWVLTRYADRLAAGGTLTGAGDLEADDGPIRLRQGLSANPHWRGAEGVLL